MYNRFIVVMVDETNSAASGCSIDSLHRFMKELEKALNIQLFDRLHIAWKDQEKVVSANRNTSGDMLKSGQLHSSTLVVNKLVSTKRKKGTRVGKNRVNSSR